MIEVRFAPGGRVYLGKDEIKRVQGGLGISIMTTPKGVITGRQARREGVGGEILCEVWKCRRISKYKCGPSGEASSPGCSGTH